MLSREDVVAVASRIFAVFVLVWTLRMASAFFATGPAADWTVWEVSLVSLSFFASLGLAALLWYFPLTVARKLLPVMKDSGPDRSTGPSHLELLAFSILGAWVLAGALSDATYWFAFALVTNGSEYGEVQLGAENIASIWTTVIELLIGFFLLFGARGLVALLRHLRYAGGYYPTEPAAPATGEVADAKPDEDPRA